MTALPPTRHKLRILLVEDSPGDAELIRISLSEGATSRFQVQHVTLLGEAIAYLEAGNGADVILLDLSLPDAEGEITVSRMRGHAPGLPIVIMTGFDDPDFAARMVASGAQDYLVKGDASGRTIWRAIRYAISRMQAAQERETLVKELRALVDLKNRMFGILAHDLRNPIGAAAGYAEMIEYFDGDKLTDRMRGSLHSILDATTYMNALIDDVLSLAVTEADDVNLIRRNFDLGELVGKAVETASVTAGRKGVRLTAEGEAVVVEADPLKIEQVLNNLISNAVKFSQSGDEVVVSARNTEAGPQFAVTDHGTGIPPGVRDHLFVPFAKGQTGTGGERSNGLGLYICSRIVEAHQGRIEVQSEIGKGSVFTVTLPPSAAT